MYYSRLRIFVKCNVILNFGLVVWQAGVTPFQRRQSVLHVQLVVMLPCFV